MSRSRVCQIAAAAALAWTLTGVSGAQAATADAASAPTAASAPLEAGSQYTIHPGQSLNDVAIAATQSHDRATLARASKALFDANPNAFMSHDPSRLRLGAVLTIPALDTTGAAVGASGAMAASSGAAATSNAATAGSASAPASPATPPAASAESQSTAAQANGASVAAHAPAATIPASAPLQASSATTAVASAPLAGSAPATVAQGAASAAVGASSTVPAAALPPAQASGAHVWAGAIQPSASAPVAGASEALPSAPSATAPVAQAPTQVSSLQQLLALKSRVLMELQKHGIGGKPAQPAQAGAVATAGGQASAAAGLAAGSGVPPNGGTATTHVSAGNLDLSPVNLGFAAAIGVALVALLAAFGLRRRKTRVTPADAAVAARVEALGRPEAGATPVSVAPHSDIDARERAVPDEDDVSDAAAVAAVSPEAAAREAAEREAAAQEAAEREAAARDAALRGATLDQEPAPLPHDAASHEPSFTEESAPDTHGGASDSNVAAVPSAFDATEHASSAAPHATPSADTHAGALNPFEDTASAADFAGTAEPRAEALPPTQFEAEAEQASHRAQSDVDQWNQAANHSLDETTVVEPAESHNPPLPQIDFGAPAPLGEPQTDSPFGQTFGGEPTFNPASYQHLDTPTAQPEAPIEHNPFEPAPHAEPPLAEALHAEAPHAEAPHAETTSHEPPAPHDADTAFPLEPASTDAPAEPSAATGFPRAAVDAFGSLDMGLPPRVEPLAPLTPPASLSTQPVVEPEITAQQAVPPLPAAPRHAADEINAGIAGAGSAAVAGLGAAHFGALNLDFDLELPPSPAQPLPSFTPQDLVRIARNKLDLASEYIELGDLAGARSLIHEVIEANDAATRTEARALLSTLSPLS
jgi:FimV-like protein